jgi:hypothetical protein
MNSVEIIPEVFSQTTGSRGAKFLFDLTDVLVSGGDTRVSIDPKTRVNKYLCPVLPAPEMTCFSNCTATPISSEAFIATVSSYERLVADVSSRDASSVLLNEAREVRSRVLAHFEVSDVAELLLAPSGTDATLLLMGLLVAETPNVPITSILPSMSETGTGVPLAAVGRHFATRTALRQLVPQGHAVEGFPDGSSFVTLPIRHPNGNLRDLDELDHAYNCAIREARGRPILHLIDSSKTGVTTPTHVPYGVEVVVDACQARLEKGRLREYLGRDWPVIITGSKFFGGPPFSGAILFPKQRFANIRLDAVPHGLASYVDLTKGLEHFMSANPGTVLRWIAALVEMDRFKALPPAQISRRMTELGAFIMASTSALSTLVCLPTRGHGGAGWSAQQSIFTIAFQDPAQLSRLLTMDELQRVYRRLARENFLVGQPVEIGSSSAALRIAIGARTIFDPAAEAGLARLFSAIEHLSIPSGPAASTNDRANSLN